MGEVQRLPLFPLNTVLFPGMVLPLHIFEPRYRLMIGRCIQENTPFGVVLIREGVEVGGNAVPHEIGTSAYVINVERLPDGRMDISTVGHQRYRVREIVEERPFLIAAVEDRPLQGIQSPDAERIAVRLSGVLRKYLDVLTRSVGLKLSAEQIPAENMPLAYFAATVLPIPPDEKQALLAIDDLPELLKTEYTLFKRENMLLGQMIKQQQRGGTGSLFSAN